MMRVAFGTPSARNAAEGNWDPAGLDRAERERIVRELDQNFLVEAGAGSGKTTELVNRMVSLIGNGRRVDRIAAVTFTRKAAGELSQRFRIELENAYREAAKSGSPTSHLDDAVRNVDRAFVGTIHAFCARLLREHPLEAGVDPGFAELGEAEAKLLAERYWTWHLDARHATGDAILARLHDVGIQPPELKLAFLDRLEHSDVHFPAGPCPPPDYSAEMAELVALMNEAEELLRIKPLEVDELQKMLRRLRFLRKSNGWRSARDFCAALETMNKSGCKARQMSWSDDPAVKKRVGDLGRRFQNFLEQRRDPLLERWYAHRYPIVLQFLDPLARDFRLHRQRAGQLTFQDLLQLTAELLRGYPDVRKRLGERYRHLLVDEFQDTDPLQVEICLLLASDPIEGDDWRSVRPRPGALFLVGDPKQSIYRFRRADMVVYDMVYRRMIEFGRVARLTRNFRSGAAIERLVDSVFEKVFERGAPTPLQAAFAPMNTREDAPLGGVFRYELPAAGGGDNQEDIAARDAAFVASWIAKRLEGNRRPGDFLVIPYRKVGVAFYARELEKRGIPVTTTGAGLLVELELRELLVLLRALADPQDRVQTVATLEGLFFGLDPGQLWEHHASGKSLSFERAHFDTDDPVDRALQVMARWSTLSRRVPADAALETIVREIGLLPLAAAGKMAESRAGALLHALDVVSASALRGAADLRSAIEVIEAAADSAEIEAPLRPGRGDAVRVMNLHKAKGLEAPIVILVHPTGDEPRPIRRHIHRGETGVAEGYLVLNRWRDRPLAKPLNWSTWEIAERRFLDAESQRLLYVAATRAKEELVVAEYPPTLGKSYWRGLHDELMRQAEAIEYFVEDPRASRDAGPTTQAIAAEVQAAVELRIAAARPAFTRETVTGSGEEEVEFRGAEGLGREWGEIVHRAIAAMGRGREGDDLRAYCRALLRKTGRRLDDSGEPVELEMLMERLEGVRASAAWRELVSSGRMGWEVAVACFAAGTEGTPTLRTGTIDALGVTEGDEPWRLVDWKTDAVEGAEWEERERLYSAQIGKYAEMLRVLRGVDSVGSIERVR
jgi:ATP-dependent helicase/nuclease subunit A